MRHLWVVITIRWCEEKGEGKPWLSRMLRNIWLREGFYRKKERRNGGKERREENERGEKGREEDGRERGPGTTATRKINKRHFLLPTTTETKLNHYLLNDN